ncbi:family atp-dependent dna helicase [Pyrenophora seminiperda CCB06]|uniref:DNA 3'-5' helicase n=1 Tax=Pyrenophora seminiperda CCB06 TaxID=1302712 RepID=A0A3M7MGB0_9PLEO|nr:family atp-dependent dna helicase [Pyrenophora seminiperda CCB06]
MACCGASPVSQAIVPTYKTILRIEPGPQSIYKTSWQNSRNGYAYTTKSGVVLEVADVANIHPIHANHCVVRLTMDSDEFGWSSGDDEDFTSIATDIQPDAKRKLSDITTDAAVPAKRGKSTIKETTPEPSPNTLLANNILKERFGIDSFRLEQEKAITRLLDGGSAVVVFPTGGGKSLCYQVPGVAFRYQDEQLGRRNAEQSGITLVISPLIALMKDQVDALLRRGIKAAVLNSSLSRDEFLATQQDLKNGRLDLLYCAPERLNNEGFTASLKAVRGGIRLLAVDEAHCISEWGHSFRPDYLKIARFAKEAEVERVVCLTATATPQVTEDIRKAFDIPEEGLFKTTMYRPNLRLLAEANTKDTDYVAKLLVHLAKHPGPTIVYVTVQRATETLAAELKKQGFNAKPYHAGMTVPLRTQTQDEFLASKNMIVVATIAFGMGIDKPDIRNIVHFDIPDSIESYSQQIGRAGRDGKPSVCMFYLATKDFYLRNIFTYGDRPSPRSLRLLMEDICTPTRAQLKAGETFTYIYTTKIPEIVEHDTSPTAKAIRKASVKAYKNTYVALEDLAEASRIPRTDLVRKMDEWNECGAIELKREGVQNVYRLERPLPSTPKEIDDIIHKLDQCCADMEKQNLSRTKALLDLITSERCFARSIEAYFGEATLQKEEKGCGHCTWCETQKRVVMPDEPPQAPDPAKVKSVLDIIPARDDPRYLAKLAFGIKSPRMAAEGVYKTKAFESMNVCDFPELLKVFTGACEREKGEREIGVRGGSSRGRSASWAIGQ